MTTFVKKKKHIANSAKIKQNFAEVHISYAKSYIQELCTKTTKIKKSRVRKMLRQWHNTLFCYHHRLGSAEVKILSRPHAALVRAHIFIFTHLHEWNKIAGGGVGFLFSMMRAAQHCVSIAYYISTPRNRVIYIFTLCLLWRFAEKMHVRKRKNQ